MKKEVENFRISSSQSSYTQCAYIEVLFFTNDSLKRNCAPLVFLWLHASNLLIKTEKLGQPVIK